MDDSIVGNADLSPGELYEDYFDAEQEYEDYFKNTVELREVNEKRK